MANSNAVSDITALFDKYNEISLKEKLEEICSSEDVEKHMLRRKNLMDRNDRNSEEWINDYNQFKFEMLLLEMNEDEARAFLKYEAEKINEFDQMIDELPDDLASAKISELADAVATKIEDKALKSVLENDFAMRDKIV